MRVTHLSQLLVATLAGIYFGLLIGNSFGNSAIASDKIADDLNRAFVARTDIASQAKIRSLESLVSKLQARADQCRNDTADMPEQVNSTTINGDRSYVCSALAAGGNHIPSAPALWMDNLLQIHAASRLAPNDPKYAFHDFTAQLLQIVSSRLPRSVGSLPRDWTTVQRLLDALASRLQYLDGTGPEAPPVKILILGGSVLVGRNCRKLVSDLKLNIKMPLRECTWSHRLGVFLNQIFGGREVFQITKIAMGGTNTAVGSLVLEYNLLPEESKNPDVVINAYATNDMHILTILEAQSGNLTLRDKVFEMLQEFVRAVMQKKQCGGGPPLFFHLDDYLGNEQREIISTTELSQSAQVLAQYYGFASMSYANVVRELVYGDTHEHWFSPEGWWLGGGMEREIHPGMGMHIATTWVVAFNLLHVATTFCSFERWVKSDEDKVLDYERSGLSQLLSLRGEHSAVRGRPRMPPQGLPPPLTFNSSLENVSERWRLAAEERTQDTMDCTEDSESRSRCIFSWVSGLSLQQNNRTAIEESFHRYSREMKGWSLADDGDKLGYVPKQLGDRMVLEFSEVAQPIHQVTLFMLRSYGPRWNGSTVQVEVEAFEPTQEKWSPLAVRDFAGFHDKNTSEMYTEPIVLNEVKKGGSVRIRCTFTHGTTFKLMGLAVCS